MCLCLWRGWGSHGRARGASCRPFRACSPGVARGLCRGEMDDLPAPLGSALTSCFSGRPGSPAQPGGSRTAPVGRCDARRSGSGRPGGDAPAGPRRTAEPLVGSCLGPPRPSEKPLFCRRVRRGLRGHPTHPRPGRLHRAQAFLDRGRPNRVARSGRPAFSSVCGRGRISTGLTNPAIFRPKKQRRETRSVLPGRWTIAHRLQDLTGRTSALVGCSEPRRTFVRISWKHRLGRISIA